MAESLSEIFGRLLAKQQILLERYHVLEDKLKAADNRVKELESETMKQKVRIEKLEMDNEYLLMVRQIAPDRETLKKGHDMITRLVRDVDKCIEQLKE